MPLKLATILAHPDDETFGTGGTLIRYAREGTLVHSLCLTQGEKGWAGIDDKIVPRELQENCAVVAALAYTLADLPQNLPR